MNWHLSDADREALAEPIYEAYRLGKYGSQEYLPMWHELDDKPTAVYEMTALTAAVQHVVAKALRAASSETRTIRSGYANPRIVSRQMVGKWLHELADQIEASA